MLREFSTLRILSKNGKHMTWRTWVTAEDRDGPATILVEYGYDTLKRSEKAIEHGSNLGKKNELTAFERAVALANAKHEKQIEAGYAEVRDLPDIPSLAPWVPDAADRDVFVQARYSGIPVVAFRRGEETLVVAREGRLRHVPIGILLALSAHFDVHPHPYEGVLRHDESAEVRELLLDLADRDYDDDTNAKLADVALVVTDTFVDAPFADRRRTLETLRFYDALELADVVQTKSHHVAQLQTSFLERGHDGLVVRYAEDPAGVAYEAALYKEKTYPVVDVVETPSGKLACVCRGEGETKFHVLMRSPFDGDPRGRRCVVRFESERDDGVPRFPVGISIDHHARGS